MVITESQLEIRYSGSASKSGPGGPQGGVISSNKVTEQTIEGGVDIANTIFEDVTNQESANGKVQYVCLYLKNTHGTQTASKIKMWQSSITPATDRIRLGYSGVGANNHDPLLSETNTSVYHLALGTSESRLDHDRFRAGVYVANTAASIYNKALVLVEFYLQRFGTPTGTLRVRQYRRNSPNYKVEFGTMDVTTINNSTPTLYQFIAAGNTVKVSLEDIISVGYFDGDENNYISVMRQPGSPIPNMHTVNWDGTQWRTVSDFDLCGNMYVAGTSGDTITPTGVTFEHPVSRDTGISLPNLTAGSFVPFWVMREVPANSPNYTNNTSELAFDYECPET